MAECYFSKVTLTNKLLLKVTLPHGCCLRFLNFTNYNKLRNALQLSLAYLGPCKTSLMELFAKIVSALQPLSIFTKSFIILI